MRAVGVIPARLESSRLPRKLLLDQTGKPLLEYTWQATCQAASLADVIVATDSAEIKSVVEGFGGRCEMTGEHTSGTDRVAEVARAAGAAAKVCGAGVRGVVAVWAPPGARGPGRREAVTEALGAAGFRVFPARVDLRGLEVG